MNSTLKPLLFGTTLFVTHLLSGVHAEEARAFAPQNSYTLQLGFASQVDAELDNGSSFTSTDAYVEIGMDRVVNPNLILGASFGFGQKSYDFDSDTGLSAGEPWSDIQRLEVGFSATWIRDRWVYLAMPSVSSYAEDGASFSDSVTAGLITGAMYQFNERLSLGLGFGVSGQVEDDAEFFPFPLIRWQITDRLRLENATTFAATLGPGAGLYYDLNDRWTAGILARDSLFRFRLDEEGTTPNGVGEESHTAVYAHVDYAISDDALVSLFGGYQFNGELRLEDENGNKLADEEYDNPFILGIYSRISF